MDKEVGEVIRYVQELPGWRVEIGSDGHARLFPPSGARPISLAGTPSDRRWKKNLVAALRREGVQWPPKSKKQQRAERREEQDE